MEKKKLFNIKGIVGTGLLLAVEVVLQVLSMIIPSAVTINLSLIPITLGAILYGPIAGLFLGVMCGVIVLVTPNTVNLFMAVSPVATILVCLFKTGLAGLLAGFIYKWLKNKHSVAGSILASLVVPIVNTAIFSVVCYFFFLDALGLKNFWEIFTVLIGINFAFEIVSNTIICPSLLEVLNHVKKSEPID